MFFAASYWFLMMYSKVNHDSFQGGDDTTKLTFSLRLAKKTDSIVLIQYVLDMTFVCFSIILTITTDRTSPLCNYSCRIIFKVMLCYHASLLQLWLFIIEILIFLYWCFPRQFAFFKDRLYRSFFIPIRRILKNLQTWKWIP